MTYEGGEGGGVGGESQQLAGCHVLVTCILSGSLDMTIVVDHQLFEQIFADLSYSKSLWIPAPIPPALMVCGCM